MFQGKYELNQISPTLVMAFGISNERYKEIMNKLNAVANIYPKYVPVIEVWMNCNSFTDKEKAFGLFCLGKLFGMGVMVKRAKLKIAFPIADPMGKLFKKLYNGTREIDGLTEKLLNRGVKING